MKAKDFLKQLQKLDKMIENKLAEKEQWKAIAYNITPQSKSVVIDGVLQNVGRVQATGSQSKMADAIEKYIDVEREIDRCVDELIDRRTEILAVIERLDAMEYDITHKLYVQYLTLDEVAGLHGKSYRWVAGIHGSALQNVQKILDEQEKAALIE